MNTRSFTKRIKRWIDKYLRKPADGTAQSGTIKSLRDLYTNKKYYQRISKLIPSLTSYKKETVVYVEKRAAEAGCDSIKDYYRLLKNNEEERKILSQRLTLTGSHFFRGDEWEYFNKNCLSHFEDAKEVRIWCAGCSSGQEVYSVIMSLMDYVPVEKISVLATDYNDEMIAKTRAGKYYNMHIDEVPAHYRKYVVEGTTQFTFKAEILNAVRAEKLNLLTDSYPTGFDIILCRNVIKFFAKKLIPKVQKNLSKSLAPGGYLFVGNSDGNKKVEMIDDPASLGLEQQEDLCIYRKSLSSNS